MRERAWALGAAAVLGILAVVFAVALWSGRDGGPNGAAPESEAAREADAAGEPGGGGPRGGRRGGPIGGPARSPAEATEAFLAFDANGDGTLDRAEAPSQHQSLVTRADADGDGAASREEILALMEEEASGSEGERP